MEGEGCVLVKNCPEGTHRNFEIKLFENPNGVGNNDNDWPIRFILSSYYHTYGHDGLLNLFIKLKVFLLIISFICYDRYS